MFRITICALALAALAAAPAARAGELDRESIPAAKSAALTAPSGASEMDRESPQSAHGWRWGWTGPNWGWGRGWGGWGWGGFYPARYSYSYFNFGLPSFYRPWGFYNGFSLGFGYHSFFPGYYYSPLYWWW